MEIFESSCNASLSDCGNVLQNTIKRNLVDFGAHFWRCSAYDTVCAGYSYDPFDRVLSKPGELKLIDTVLHFLYGRNRTEVNVKLKNYFPTVYSIRGKSSEYTRLQSSIHYVWETPRLKFFTLDGVVDGKSSFDVYFAPFKPQVWYLLLASAGMSFMFQIILWRVAMTGRGWPVYCVMYEVLYWKIASFIGQYSSNYLPSVGLYKSSDVHRNSEKGFTIAATAWIFFGIVVVNNYGAFFSAESLRDFPYATKFEQIAQLENFTLFYLLPEEQFAKLPSRSIPNFIAPMTFSCVSRNVEECQVYQELQILQEPYRRNGSQVRPKTQTEREICV